MEVLACNKGTQQVKGTGGGDGGIWVPVTEVILPAASLNKKANKPRERRYQQFIDIVGDSSEGLKKGILNNNIT